MAPTGEVHKDGSESSRSDTVEIEFFLLRTGGSGGGEGSKRSTGDSRLAFRKESACSHERLDWERERPAAGSRSLGSAWSQRGDGPLQRCPQEYSAYASKARVPLKMRRHHTFRCLLSRALSVSNNKMLLVKYVLAKTTRVSMLPGSVCTVNTVSDRGRKFCHLRGCRWPGWRRAVRASRVAPRTALSQPIWLV